MNSNFLIKTDFAICFDVSMNLIDLFGVIFSYDIVDNYLNAGLDVK